MNTHDELEQMLTRDLHDQVDGMTEAPLRPPRRAGPGAQDPPQPTDRGRGRGGGGARAHRPDDDLQHRDARRHERDPAGALARPDSRRPGRGRRTTLTVDGLERGDDPAIEYFTPDGVVLPGEGTQALAENYQALAPGTDGGWIALGPAVDEVVYLSEDLEREGGTPSGSGFVTTPERDLVAWTVPTAGTQTILVRSTTRPEDTMSWDFPERPSVDPVGILGPDSVVYETTTPQGQVSVGLARPDGTTTELPFLGAMAADPVNQVFAAQTETRPGGGCFAVVEASTLLPAWETCDYALGSFSPDGAHVMAAPVEGDGAGPSSLYVLDARTGEVEAEFASRGRNLVSLIRPAWESADSIVAAAMAGATTTMLRMGVDGTLEEVADPVESSAYEDVYYWIGKDRAGL